MHGMGHTALEARLRRATAGGMLARNAARGVEGLVVLPSTPAAREVARALRRRLLDGDAATLLPGALSAGGWLEALRTAEERLRCGGRGEGTEGALSSVWCKVVRLEPTEFVPQALQPELIGLVALAGQHSPVEVMHRSKDRAAMTKQRLSLGDAMLRGSSCRTNWFLAVPPTRPPLQAAEQTVCEDEVRFLLQIFHSAKTGK